MKVQTKNAHYYNFLKNYEGLRKPPLQNFIECNLQLRLPELLIIKFISLYHMRTHYFYFESD